MHGHPHSTGSHMVSLREDCFLWRLDIQRQYTFLLFGNAGSQRPVICQEKIQAACEEAHAEKNMD